VRRWTWWELAVIRPTSGLVLSRRGWRPQQLDATDAQLIVDSAAPRLRRAT
jgi:hypothetical protein